MDSRSRVFAHQPVARDAERACRSQQHLVSAELLTDAHELCVRAHANFEAACERVGRVLRLVRSETDPGGNMVEAHNLSDACHASRRREFRVENFAERQLVVLEGAPC
jgi:hypothetical protein